MKKILLLSLAVVCYLNVNAQTIKKTSLAIYGGPSLPMGDFADINVFNEESGLANTGGFLAIDYGYRFSRRLGIALGLRTKSYSISDDAFAYYSVPSGTGASLRINTGTWKLNDFMVGFFYSMALTKTKKLNLEIRALGGLQTNSSPTINATIIVPGAGTLSSNQPKYSANSFAYLVGLNLKYQIGKAIGLKLSADYGSSQPKFMVDLVDANGINLGIGQSKQHITAVDLGVGVYLAF